MENLVTAWTVQWIPSLEWWGGRIIPENSISLWDQQSLLSREINNHLSLPQSTESISIFHSSTATYINFSKNKSPKILFLLAARLRLIWQADLKSGKENELTFQGMCLRWNRQTKTAFSWVVSSGEVTKLEHFNDMEMPEAELKEYMKKSFVIRKELKQNSLYTHTPAVGTTGNGTWDHPSSVIHCTGENIPLPYRIATHVEMLEVRRLFILSLFNNKHS